MTEKRPTSHPIRTERLLLRLPGPRDVEQIRRAGNYPQVARGTYMPYPLGRARAAQIVARRRREARAGRSLGLVISERRTGRIIGMIGLGAIDRHDRGAELYYWITPSEWGRGYASEAARAMLAVAFGRMRLHRVTAHVHTLNSASLRVLRKLGFRREGRLREVRPEGRRWQDAWVLGLLHHEFRVRPIPARRASR